VAAMAVADPALRIACIQAYNDWLIEFCSAAPNRLLGVAILPPEDPAGARAEVYRLAKQGGLRQANLQVARVTSRLHDAGIRLRRDSVVSVMYAEELNSTTSSVTLQRTDRHGILGQKSSPLQVSL